MRNQQNFCDSLSIYQFEKSSLQYKKQSQFNQLKNLDQYFIDQEMKFIIFIDKIMKIFGKLKYFDQKIELKYDIFYIFQQNVNKSPNMEIDQELKRIYLYYWKKCLIIDYMNFNILKQLYFSFSINNKMLGIIVSENNIIFYNQNSIKSYDRFNFQLVASTNLNFNVR